MNQEILNLLGSLGIRHLKIYVHEFIEYPASELVASSRSIFLNNALQMPFAMTSLAQIFT